MANLSVSQTFAETLASAIFTASQFFIDISRPLIHKLFKALLEDKTMKVYTKVLEI
jgi:hypothetical protein